MVLSLDTQKLITFADNEWDLKEKIKCKVQGFYNSQPLTEFIALSEMSSL
jgi:hypothetical protein